jgi:SagB-type dehydrogenase family enzyme
MSGALLFAVVLGAISLAMLGGCEASGGAELPPGPVPDRRVLPAPQRDGGMPLARALAGRRSVRTFGPRSLHDAELGQLLWAAQGISDGHRTAPSAGALYPLTVRVADARGVWRYAPAEHELHRETSEDRRSAVADASFGQEAVRAAPVMLVISAEIAITARKYGLRAERYAALEAGHAAQNVLLTAAALDLGAVPVGAFDDGALRRALAVAGDATPLYVIPVGVPR